MPGPSSATVNRDLPRVRRRTRATRISVSCRRVLAGVVEQDVDHFRDRRGIDRQRRQPIRHVDAARGDSRVTVPARATPRADHVRDVGAAAQASRLRAVGALGGGEPFDEAIQSIRFLVDHLQQLAAALARQSGRPASRLSVADQRRDRRLDRGERRPQVVRQRIEQRRLQLLVAARGLRFARAIEGRLQLLVQAARSRGGRSAPRRCRRSARAASQATIAAWS